MSSKIQTTMAKSKNIKKSDILGRGQTPWVYSKTVKEHFFCPKNFMKPEEEKKLKFNASGMVGSPACGDVMRFWLFIDPKTEKIKQCRWRTFGCGAAIGSTSMLSVMLTEKGGMSIEKARKIKPQDIVKRLGGLPEIKYHCSVLGDKALRNAINDYFRQTNQMKRIVPEEGRIIDPDTKTTDKDIEMAVLEGADTLEKVQERTKVGVANPKIIPEIEQLIRFYKEKYSI
ncbi:MAG: iron-sulfur cluster assembly scaffold protein [bacterium]|nr:iron-sulfur cluster assembly scaffold protein [bacterium]